MNTFYTHDGTPYTGRHPRERQPSPSKRLHPHWAIQPYKPKPLAPGDIVRFKTGDQDWLVKEVGPTVCQLTRRDMLGTYSRTLDRADEHHLMIIAQYPRRARRVDKRK